MAAFAWWAFFVSLKKKKRQRKREQNHIIMGEKGKKRTQDEMEGGEEDAVEIMPGTIKSVRLQNFMCHEHLLVDLGPRINFITGENGSGKSAVLTALTLALGTSARKTNRTSKDGVKGLIRTGQHSAKIIVELRNEGSDAFEPEKFGDVIIIEKNIVNTGGSTMKMKTRHGPGAGEKKEVTVYTKSEDLARMCDHLNLNCENPICVMTQDGSREFLSSGKDRDKYNFYMKATLLESVLSELQTSKDRLDLMGENLKIKEQTIPEMESLVADLETKMQMFTLRRKLSTELHLARILFPWAGVAAMKLEMDKLTEEIEEANAQLQQFDAQLKARGAKKEKYENKRKELGEEVEKIKSQEIGQALLRKQEYTDSMKTAERMMISAKRATDGAEANVKDKVKERDNQKRLLETEKEKAVSATQNASGQNDAALLAAKAKYEKARGEKEAFEMAVKEVNERVTKADFEVRNISNRIRGKEQSVNQQQQTIKRMENASKDANAQFGEWVPKLLDVIKKNENKFSRPPIGPVGANVLLKQDKWGLCVEECCGREFEKFLVHSPKDVSVLQKIAKDANCKVPVIACMNFDAPRYNTKENSPDGSLLTVLDVLDFKNNAVFNYLVDKAQVERVMLTTSDKEAASIVHHRFGQPKHPKSKNVAYALTVDMRSYRQIGGTQQVQPFRRQVLNSPVRLIKDKKAEIGKAKLKLVEIQTEMKDAQKAMERERKALSDAKAEQTKIESGRLKIVRNVRTALDEYQNKKQEVQEAVQDVAEVDLEELERELAEKEEALVNSEDEKRVLMEDHVQKKEDYVAKKAALDSFIDNQVGLSAQLDKYDTDLSACVRKIETEEETLKKLSYGKEEKMKERDVKVKMLDEKKLEFVESEKNVIECTKSDKTGESIKSLEEAEAHKADFDVYKGIDAAQKHIQSIKNKIAREEAMHEQPFEEVRDLLDEAKSKLNKTKRSLKNTKEPKNLLSKLVKKRKLAFEEVATNVKREVSGNFGFHLSKKPGCGGGLDVDYTNRTLTMNVQMKNKTVTNINGLSGGERSFTTLALTLAMGELSESPFRAMDEFDVFMDEVARKVSMNSLLEFARGDEELSRQFILITPQNISGIDAKAKDIHVFQMRAPRT